MSIPEVSSKAGQMRLASRASRIAVLKLINEQIKELAPNEVWAESAIESASDTELDNLQDVMSATLVSIQKGRSDTKESLLIELRELGTVEIRKVFELLNLQEQHRMAFEDYVNVLLNCTEIKVREAIKAVNAL